jgi:acyl-CoA synthetase (AMP-forming)/AMP-acid ligase II
MSAIDFLVERFEQHREADAIVWNATVCSYQQLLELLSRYRAFLETEQIGGGTVVALEGDFSPHAIALLLALIERNCIIVPLTASVRQKRAEFLEVALAEVLITVDESEKLEVTRLNGRRDHRLYDVVRQAAHPGLVVFSSGSTGKSKAAVHDFVPLLEKFRRRRKAFRTLTFLLFDHLGGLNTLLHTLSNGGCVIVTPARTPDAVLETIERFGVELLPTSPTFLNLMLLSEAYLRHDLSSLKLVTYGTEPMPESTLKKFCSLFPGVQMLQTYGLSEIGVLRSKSKSSDSLWLKIGGDEFATRVVDGLLQIKAPSAMLGYLNAPSPFTEDGWLITGDSVEVDGEYLKILGRKSELINVGGQKVYPNEIEGVILEMENVAEVLVYGERNAIMGTIVCAKVRLRDGENDASAFPSKLKQFCQSRMEPYKIPVRILVEEKELSTERFKKGRVPQVEAQAAGESRS